MGATILYLLFIIDRLSDRGFRVNYYMSRQTRLSELNFRKYGSRSVAMCGAISGNTYRILYFNKEFNI